MDYMDQMNHIIAGAPLSWWIGFHLVVLALICADFLLPTARAGFAWLWTLFLATLAVGFATWIGFEHGRKPALEFISGYLIETSLSIDNLFVFLLIFRSFGLGPQKQRAALSWGVGGAVLLRAVFIAAGVALLSRFEWITTIFGAILLYAAWRLIFSHEKDALPGFVTRLKGNSSSIVPVILAVELTDVLFAIDSIPAVLAVSREPFLVYTSNIVAILGLRSLYFALAGMLDTLRYLHYGLGALLGFVAIKMLGAHWFEIPILWSLAIMGAILGICALASILAPKQQTTL